ncbi:hypothetical protein PR202_gb11258 [Eleusine coracana subsp. coracana]|uniref:Uncharacterized protein n=1 Tax=Eleusine coracana subsp. coracana TaxID=191504 RepID=A0AAV5EJR5_ELECO|nr:hypothetical protein PR202_gb11258 [Eleusine coracana subsp. coracana]
MHEAVVLNSVHTKPTLIENDSRPGHLGREPKADGGRIEETAFHAGKPDLSLEEYHPLMRAPREEVVSWAQDPMCWKATENLCCGPSSILTRPEPTEAQHAPHIEALTEDRLSIQQEAQPTPTPGLEGQAIEPAQAVQPERTQEFINLVTRPVQEPQTTPAPAPAKRSRRQPASSTTLRRSRRIANSAGPNHAVQKAQMVLMRKLGLAIEENGLSQEARDAYAKLFEHPLSPSHLAALAALFGWAVPDSAPSA